MDAVKEMRSQGRRVEFMLFAPSRDQEWLERLREAGESPICWDPSALTIDEFLAKVASYDLVITARYHGAVFAALLGVPCVSISVEPKLDLVATLFGAGAREWGYPFLSCSLLAAVESLERRYADAVEALRIMVEAQGMLAAEMRRELCREIDRKLGSRRS